MKNKPSPAKGLGLSKIYDLICIFPKNCPERTMSTQTVQGFYSQSASLQVGSTSYPK